MLLTTRCVLLLALLDLERRALPTRALARLLGEVEARIADGEELVWREPVPHLVPMDLRRCTEDSVLNWNAHDDEIEVPRGFSIQASATAPTAFAKPYYVDPAGGRHRCSGLSGAREFSRRSEWTFDLSFVGHRGRRGTLRNRFLTSLVRDYRPRAPARVHLQLNERFFYAGAQSSAARRARNERSRYVESINDSRFILCPRGLALNSIRFFEALACANVPIYVGDRRAKLPLDWIIDWDRMCVRIPLDEVADGSFTSRLDDVLATGDREHDERRRYIFEIYHQFLAPERVDVFEQLVLLRCRELLRERQAGLGRRVSPNAANSRPRLGGCSTNRLAMSLASPITTFMSR